MKLDLEVTGSNEYLDYPGFIRVDITEALKDRIVKLHKALMSVDADYIHEFDYTPEFLNFPPDWEDDTSDATKLVEGAKESDFRSSATRLCVDTTHFCWEGYEKYSGSHWGSTSFNIRHLQIKMAKKEDLPLLAADPDFEKYTNVIETRLKELA